MDQLLEGSATEAHSISHCAGYAQMMSPVLNLGFSSKGNTSSDIPSLAQDVHILFVDAFVSSITI
jgi:hypothetical protein